MNPDLPTPREEQEARLTALLLGELPPPEAAAVRQTLAHDASQAALYERLKQTIELVREVAADPIQDQAPSEPARLSEERRQKLWAQFKTVAPQEFVRPARKRVSWFVPLTLAATLVGLACLIGFLCTGRFDFLSDEGARAWGWKVPSSFTMIGGEALKAAAPSQPQGDLAFNLKGLPLGNLPPREASDASTHAFGGGGLAQSAGYRVAGKAELAQVERESTGKPAGSVSTRTTRGLAVPQAPALMAQASEPPPAPKAANGLQIYLPETSSGGRLSGGNLGMMGGGAAGGGGMGGTPAAGNLNLSDASTRSYGGFGEISPNAPPRSSTEVSADKTAGDAALALAWGDALHGNAPLEVDRLNGSKGSVTEAMDGAFQVRKARPSGEPGAQPADNSKSSTTVPIVAETRAFALNGLNIPASPDLNLDGSGVSATPGGAAHLAKDAKARAGVEFAETPTVNFSLAARPDSSDLSAISSLSAAQASALGDLAPAADLLSRRAPLAGHSAGEQVHHLADLETKEVAKTLDAGRPANPLGMTLNSDVFYFNAAIAESKPNEQKQQGQQAKPGSDAWARNSLPAANHAVDLPMAAPAALPAVMPPPAPVQAAVAGDAIRLKVDQVTQSLQNESLAAQPLDRNLPALRSGLGQDADAIGRFTQLGRKVAASDPRNKDLAELAPLPIQLPEPTFKGTPTDLPVNRPAPAASAKPASGPTPAAQAGATKAESEEIAKRQVAAVRQVVSGQVPSQNSPGLNGNLISVRASFAPDADQKAKADTKKLARLDTDADQAVQFGAILVTNFVSPDRVTPPLSYNWRQTPADNLAKAAAATTKQGLAGQADSQRADARGSTRMRALSEEKSSSRGLASRSKPATPAQKKPAEQELKKHLADDFNYQAAEATLKQTLSEDSLAEQRQAVVRRVVDKAVKLPGSALAEAGSDSDSLIPKHPTISVSAKASGNSQVFGERMDINADARRQTLATLRINQLNAKALLNQDREKLTKAQSDLTNSSNLFKNHVIDQGMYDSAKAAFNAAKSQVEDRSIMIKEFDDMLSHLKPSVESSAINMSNVIRQDIQTEQARKEPELSVPRRAPAGPIPEQQPEVAVTENAFSTFSLNVADVSWKLAGASLEKGQMPDPSTVRSEEFINALDYRDPSPPPGAPLAFAFERARYPFAHNRDVVRFALKTAALGRQQGRPLNLVLLLDNSGSMERADRVRIIHEALKVLAAQLQPQDKISVIAFARTARLWIDALPGSQAGELAQKVGDLNPEGGTNLEEAMNLGYATARRHFLEKGINRVVILTDGAANLGNVEPEVLKQKVEENRKQGIALDCFGIGWEGYNDDLLEVLSRNGDGRYEFVNSPEEASTEFAAQLAGALKVTASDVKVQIEFNPRRVTAYRQVGYAKHQLKKEQFRDNTVDAAEIAAEETGNALYILEVNPSGDGPLGMVRVRYKAPGTSDYHELEWEAPYSGSAVPLEQASPALRLAVSAAAFAEWLISSPFAAEVTPDRLLGYLNGVPEIYGADSRPKRLEWMIRQAKGISGQ